MRLAVAVCYASLCAAQPAADPQLARIRERVAQILARIPNYTCVENIKRSQRLGESGYFGGTERIRLEVAEAGRKKLFAPVGARQFENGSVVPSAGWGVVTNGEFVQYLRAIFENEYTKFRDRGRQDVDGASCLQYEYEVPAAASDFRVTYRKAAAFVGFHGSVWVDAESFDLVRLEIVADQIPRNLGVSKATTEILYAPFHIGDGTFLLPQKSVLVTDPTSASAYAFRNETEFTHCRQYSGTSTISFGDLLETHGAALDERAIVEGMHFNLTLDSPLDLQSARIGDSVDAVLSADVVWKGKVIVPAGAHILGRLRRMEKNSERASRRVLTFEFSEIESGGSRARFFAELRSVHWRQGRVEVLHDSHLPGIATFAFDETLKIAANDLQMTWTVVKID